MTKPPGTKQRRLGFSIRQATLRCCLSFLTSLGDPLSGEAPGVGDSGIRLPLCLPFPLQVKRERQREERFYH